MIIRSSDTPGSYTVASNCSGSLSFTGGPSFDLIADPRGAVVFMVQTARRIRTIRNELSRAANGTYPQ